MSCYTTTLEETVEELESELRAAREQIIGLRSVFEAARKVVGLREGCTYAAVVEHLRALPSRP